MENLNLEKQDEIFQRLNRILKEELGENKYALILAYEAVEKTDEKTGETNAELALHTITKLDSRSPLYSWKLVLAALQGRVQEFINIYDYNYSEAASPREE
jgi:hypothetical protein